MKRRMFFERKTYIIFFSIFLVGFIFSNLNTINHKVYPISSEILVSFRNSLKAWAVTTKPGGIGSFAFHISPKFAPLPPTIPTSSFVISLNHETPCKSESPHDF